MLRRPPISTLTATLFPDTTLCRSTMTAGAGLNNRDAVEFVVENAPAVIERLADLGVPFNPGEAGGERWHLTQEGGHSHRRIVHVDDRSEEHTSELQSLMRISYAVFCLKKKNTT